MTSNEDLNIKIDALLIEVKSLKKELKSIKSLTYPFGTYVGNGILFTQTAKGLRYYIPSDDEILLPKMIGSRVWEPTVTRHILRYIDPKLDFIDVGANIGYYSVLVAAELDPKIARVHAFEPNPKSILLLKKNVTINWSIAPISVNEHALGAETGKRILFTPKHRVLNTSFYDMSTIDYEYGFEFEDEIEQINIEVKRLDDVIENKNSVGMLKIDVEGSELEVLKGAKDLISSAPNLQIIMEFSKVQLDQTPEKAEGLLNFLSCLDFDIYKIQEKPARVTVSELQNIEYANLHLKRKS